MKKRVFPLFIAPSAALAAVSSASISRHIARVGALSF
jgi:hypothetical protein